MVQDGSASSHEMCEKHFAVLGELLGQMRVGGLAFPTHRKRLQHQEAENACLGRGNLVTGVKAIIWKSDNITECLCLLVALCMVLNDIP